MSVIMVYLYDFIFIMLFLGFKQFMKFTQDTNQGLFEVVRQYGFWFEYGLILIGIYFAPVHSMTERGVSFMMCMLTKLIVDFILPENYRKNGN